MDTLFFHSNPNKRGERVTVAGIVTEDGHLRFGISKCSKKDMFTKKRGRQIAEGRAKSDHSTYDIVSTDLKPETRTVINKVTEEPQEIGMSVAFWFKQQAEEIAAKVLNQKKKFSTAEVVEIVKAIIEEEKNQPQQIPPDPRVFVNNPEAWYMPNADRPNVPHFVP